MFDLTFAARIVALFRGDARMNFAHLMHLKSYVNVDGDVLVIVPCKLKDDDGKIRRFEITVTEV